MDTAVKRLIQSIAVSSVGADNENYQLGLTIKEGKEIVAAYKQLEEDCRAWRLSCGRYGKILVKNKICPDCETVGEVCDCPYG